ncbi:MAG TPA: hypothetical protein VMB66_04410 [Candidatus Acidoferrales bacterium]|nr:hypothetical protein [Candidatus Acidoferrales bacterium]
MKRSAMCQTNLGSRGSDAIAPHNPGELGHITNPIKDEFGILATSRQMFKTGVDEAGSCHTRLGADSHHLLDRVENCVIDSFPESDVQRGGGLDVGERNHDSPLKERERNRSSQTFRRQRKIGAQNGTGPLSCQGCCYLLLGDGSHRLKPVSNPAAATSTLSLKRCQQLVLSNLMAREKNKSQGNSMRGYVPCGRIRAFQGPNEGGLETFLDTHAPSVQQDRMAASAKVLPISSGVRALVLFAAGPNCLPRFTPGSAPGSNCAVCHK